jgi:hypothetical protein
MMISAKTDHLSQFKSDVNSSVHFDRNFDNRFHLNIEAFMRLRSRILLRADRELAGQRTFAGPSQTISHTQQTQIERAAALQLTGFDAFTNVLRLLEGI